jgi:hypothetical protein|tara:strand:+ start:2253 stop:2495 length:243 start_codon:yes stop_codon:yes gene_type:complete
MPVFALQYELTLYYSGESTHHLKYAGEVNVQASSADTARRKLSPALALTGLSPVLAQDSTFDPHYDDVEISIRGIQEKTL